MTQAARSCKQNIAEGSAASGTSRETEIKLASQEEDFRLHGGVRERMHAARTATRSADWDKALHSRLSTAATPAALSALAREIKQAVDRSVESIRRRNGWG